MLERCYVERGWGFEVKVKLGRGRTSSRPVQFRPSSVDSHNWAQVLPKQFLDRILRLWKYDFFFNSILAD